jgi:hypothetical protein
MASRITDTKFDRFVEEALQARVERRAHASFVDAICRGEAEPVHALPDRVRPTVQKVEVVHGGSRSLPPAPV